MSNMKAAVLIGLGVVMSGVCDANAATTTPVTSKYALGATLGGTSGFFSHFAQFDPSLGTLTSVDFSLVSSISADTGVTDFKATLNVAGATTDLGSTSSLGPFNFTDITGLQGGLTTADFTGSGTITVDSTLATKSDNTGFVHWTAGGTGQGLTLVYDYVPAGETPLPATLPLFASGLGALGLLGWRRKRKAQA